MRKKVLFIIWSFSMGGGAEKILANILNNIDLNKYDIDVLEYISFGIKHEEIPKSVNRLKPIIDNNKTNRYKRYLLDKACVCMPKFVRKFFLNKKYDIEISFNERIPCFLLDNSAKTFCWIHGSMYGIENSKKQYDLQKKVFDKACKVIAISNKTYESIGTLFPEISTKIIKIYNGYDFKLIKNLSSSYTNIKIKDQALLLIGRLEEGKQPLKAIECLHKLHTVGCLYHLYVLGNGVLFDEMKMKVKDYGLSEYVHFLGYINNPFPIIKQSMAILSFSKAEGFPTIFVEGLALGVPFISTDVGGTEELSNNGKCGRIFNTMEESIEILINLYFNKINFDDRDCIDYVKNFSIEKQIDEIEKILSL